MSYIIAKFYKLVRELKKDYNSQNMNILFLHRNFPAQFRYLIKELVKNKENKIVFITNNDSHKIPGVMKIQYRLKREVPENCHRYLRFYEEAIIHAQAAAEAAIQLRNSGFIPDIIYGHTWGQTLFMKDIFPEVPLLCYFEWFYNSVGADMGFDGEVLSVDKLAKLRSKNAHLLIDLYTCDAGICPTKFQKKQFPKEFDDKLKVIYDGVDTDYCKPNENAVFKIDNKDLVFTSKDEVVTYATRGLEAYRGFPEFMQAVERLQKRRKNLHVIIAGEDRVCYGPKLADTTYKKLMLQKLDLDLDRIHFVGKLPFARYVNLLQISSAHVYLTYPFVVSWSLFDAMSCACPIVASATEPVMEFVENNKSGLLFDFYDINEQVEKIEYALNNREKMASIRANARNVIVENYSLSKMIPQHLEYINSIIQNYKIHQMKDNKVLKV